MNTYRPRPLKRPLPFENWRGVLAALDLPPPPPVAWSPYEPGWPPVPPPPAPEPWVSSAYPYREISWRFPNVDGAYVVWLGHLMRWEPIDVGISQRIGANRFSGGHDREELWKWRQGLYWPETPPILVHVVGTPTWGVDPDAWRSAKELQLWDAYVAQGYVMCGQRP